MSKVTMKIDDKVYKKLQIVKANCDKCKFASDTVNMLIAFYVEANNGKEK